MALEVQTLLYYSKLLNRIFFSTILLIFIISLYFFYFFKIKNINDSDYIINISKGESISKIPNLILENDSFLHKKIYLIYLIIWNKYFEKIHYGEFEITKNLNLTEITSIISKPSNVYYKLTIIDGWQNYQFNKLIDKKFNIKNQIKYTDILADTYKYQSHNSFEEIYYIMKKSKDNFFKKHLSNKLFKKFNIDQIMIISSLVEREGINDHDKRLISSVIFNRIRKNMKLQIDASTIFSITRGKYKFNRKLTFNDLKLSDPYNTYRTNGLPPTPICFVSRKTIEIVLENYNSEYLFYFYNNELKKHIFSKLFIEHKKKLNKYRYNQ